MSIRVDPPMAMLAELTHRCPLACPYCSNPTALLGRETELSTDSWIDVFRQAAKLGVLQLHLSGGEPASRRDLVDLVASACEVGLYTNLITSGIGLNERRLRALDAAGLDHVQLSLQGVTAAMADRIGDYKGAFDRKMHVAEIISDIGFPLTLNAVMHRDNLDDLPATIEMALRLGARRIEIAMCSVSGLGAGQSRCAAAESGTGGRRQEDCCAGDRNVKRPFGHRFCAAGLLLGLPKGVHERLGINRIECHA